jgi:hypothetical protein
VSPRSDLRALEQRNIAVRLAIVLGLVGRATDSLILSRVLRKWLQYCIRGQTPQIDSAVCYEEGRPEKYLSFAAYGNVICVKS